MGFWFHDYRGLKQVISNICYINGIFADIWWIFMVNEGKYIGKYTIRGWYGIINDYGKAVFV